MADNDISMERAIELIVGLLLVVFGISSWIVIFTKGLDHISEMTGKDIGWVAPASFAGTYVAFGILSIVLIYLGWTLLTGRELKNFPISLHKKG